MPAHTGQAGQAGLVWRNVQGSAGCITNQLFDCLVYGCVPMYLANPGAVHCISADCYIDARTLESDLTLIEYLRGIDEFRFTVYQAAIGA